MWLLSGVDGKGQSALTHGIIALLVVCARAQSLQRRKNADVGGIGCYDSL